MNLILNERRILMKMTMEQEGSEGKEPGTGGAIKEGGKRTREGKREGQRRTTSATDAMETRAAMGWSMIVSFTFISRRLGPLELTEAPTMSIATCRGKRLAKPSRLRRVSTTHCSAMA